MFEIQTKTNKKKENKEQITNCLQVQNKTHIKLELCAGATNQPVTDGIVLQSEEMAQQETSLQRANP